MQEYQIALNQALVWEAAARWLLWGFVLGQRWWGRSGGRGSLMGLDYSIESGSIFKKKKKKRNLLPPHPPTPKKILPLETFS